MSNSTKPPYPIYPAITPGSLSGIPEDPNFAQNRQHWSDGYPVHVTKTSGLLSRCEPILTPDKLISRYLMGIPLSFPNGNAYTSDSLKDQISLAINEVENLCRVTLSREQFTDNVPFDLALYKNFIHLKTERTPILSLQGITIVSSDGYQVFSIPATWITTSEFSKGVVNVVPMLGLYSVNPATGTGSFGGIPFLLAFQNLNFMPSFWQLVYTTGVSKNEGELPIVVNDLVGTIAAMNILSAIATMFITNSQSLSRDGVSQSSSGPGPRVYALRIEELEKKRDVLVNKIKAVYANKFYISNI